MGAVVLRLPRIVEILLFIRALRLALPGGERAVIEIDVGQFRIDADGPCEVAVVVLVVQVEAERAAFRRVVGGLRAFVQLGVHGLAQVLLKLGRRHDLEIGGIGVRVRAHHGDAAADIPRLADRHLVRTRVDAQRPRTAVRLLRILRGHVNTVDGQRFHGIGHRHGDGLEQWARDLPIREQQELRPVLVDGERIVDVLAVQRIRHVDLGHAFDGFDTIDMRVGDRGVVGLRYGVGQQLELVLVHLRIGDAIGLVILAVGNRRQIALRHGFRAEDGRVEHTVDNAQHNQGTDYDAADKDRLLSFWVERLTCPRSCDRHRSRACWRLRQRHRTRCRVARCRIGHGRRGDRLWNGL